MRRLWALLALCSVAATTGAPAQIIADIVPPSVGIPDISFALAHEAAIAALAYCRRHHGKYDNPAVVEVLGASGELKVYLAEDYLHSYDAFEHARRKAYTALVTGKPSGDYGKNVIDGGNGKLNGEILDAPPLTPADFLGVAGGLPIKHGDVVVGAIAVDGPWDYRTGHDGEDWEKDAACAQAGIDRIRSRISPR